MEQLKPSCTDCGDVNTKTALDHCLAISTEVASLTLSSIPLLWYILKSMSMYVPCAHSNTSHDNKRSVNNSNVHQP